MAVDTEFVSILVATGLEGTLSYAVDWSRVKCSSMLSRFQPRVSLKFRIRFQNAMRSTGKLGNEKSVLLAHNVSSSISSEIETHTSLKYSPTSPWRKATMPVGSIFRASAVERAVTPKPYRH